MPVASIDTSTNVTISAGQTRNLYYTINAPINSEIDLVAYRLWLGNVISGTNLNQSDATGDDDVDLGKVDVYLYSPEGDRGTIFNIADSFGRQDDSVLGVDQDSDSPNDHDLYYDGSGGESTFSADFDGQNARGTYRLEIRNGSDQTLTLNYFDLDITYDPAPDLIVKDIRVEGQMGLGETITIKADISNISPTNYTDGLSSFDVEYLANGRVIGSDTLDLGFLGNLTLEYEESFTVTQVGPVEIEVRIVGTSGEATTANNSRTEYFYQNHTQQKTLTNSAEEVRLAAFMAHSAYGDIRLPEAYNGSNTDNGIDDNYRSFLSQNGLSPITNLTLGDDFDGVTSLGATVGRFTSGGLYEGRSSGLNPEWEAQGLLVRTTLENGDTALVYGIRGTDSEDNAFLGGQAWTGNGLYDHYTAHRPMIEAILQYANDPGNSIEAVIIGGHSLGGSMVDIFAAVDAQRLKSSIDLTTVTFGSAGVDPDTYIDPTRIKEFRDEYDPRVVRDLPGDDVGITRPVHHISLAHTEDRVTFDEINPSGAQLRTVTIDGQEVPLPSPDFTLVPSATLAENLDYSGITRLNLPLFGNFHKTPDPDAPTFEYGFGAEHDIGLYWANIEEMTADPLVRYYNGHTIQLGEDDYAGVGDYGGNNLAVFPTERTGAPTDRGVEALQGSSGRDWLLGLAGDDQLYGGSGDDLLSGGEGADFLGGGTGADTMAGGLGDDFYVVDNARDMVVEDTVFSQGGGIDTVRTFISNYVQPENVELVRLGNLTGTGNLNATGNDAPGVLVGNAGNNILTARGGNDQVNGNGGDDTLIGNTGRDTLVGGAGADRFIYTSISESRVGSAERDVINGFDRGADRIDLGAMDADLTRGGDQAFSFIGTGRFSGNAGELRLQGLGGPNAVLVEGDLRGDGVADFQLFVNLTTVLGAGDFIL